VVLQGKGMLPSSGVQAIQRDDQGPVTKEGGATGHAGVTQGVIMLSDHMRNRAASLLMWQGAAYGRMFCRREAVLRHARGLV
jgi:hypothetical protein